jgi:hypothetical protein
MGCRTAFFRPYLSTLDRDRPLSELGIKFHQKFDRFTDENKALTGFDKYVSKLYLNTSFDRFTKGEHLEINYDYFSDIEKYGCEVFNELVNELAFRELYADPMGASVYLRDITGLTIQDLYDMDFITFKEIDKKVTAKSDSYIKAREKAKASVENSENFKGLNL